MKRFHSPLIKLARLTTQQVELQRLMLARITTQQAHLRSQIEVLERQLQEIEHEIVTSMRNLKDPTRLAALMSARERVHASRVQAHHLKEELEALFEKEAAIYRTIAAREEALLKVLEGQRSDHRVQQQKAEQIELDQLFSNSQFTHTHTTLNGEL